MAWSKINLNRYTAEVKRNMQLSIPDEIIKKDLLLTLLLAEFEKDDVFKKLIFKGGTLLSRNYLNYHRFSEDLDFVHTDSHRFRILSRNQREKSIKQYIDVIVPQLKRVCDSLWLDFTIDRSDTKYCTILSGRTVYIFRIYYDEINYVKVEINFVEKLFFEPEVVSVKAITDYFDSKELLFTLGLDINNFRVLSYTLGEVKLEKYRALLTRPVLKERDLFDLFLIPRSLDVNITEIVDKIRASSLIKKDLNQIISLHHDKLKNNSFFETDERIADLAIVRYDLKSFEQFKIKVAVKLRLICEEFLK